MLSVTRCYAFSAAHRLFVRGWDDGRNDQAFGKCARPEGHGHNYRLEVTVCGTPDPETGLVADRTGLDRVVRAEVLDRLDHRDLLPVLRAAGYATATSENVCRWILDRLSTAAPGLPIRKVGLRETERNRFEIVRPCAEPPRRGEGPASPPKR
ncbi:MAG: 6-carboxytetrahydropterin synthase [Acidobacteria bacterium]|nr:6-carboxytetrahydropterin synthase [Acidobacteriota bacterium]